MEEARRRPAPRLGRRRSPTSAAFARATPSASASHQLRELVREASGAAALGQQDPPGHAIVRALAAALAGTPALTEDVDAAPDTAGAAATELAQRYTRVRNAAAAAATDARTAAAPAATENARRRALVRIARWGITPLAEGSTLAERLVRAAEVLERRIAEAPATLEGATVEVIAGAIGALVSPEGPFPVFARLRAATFAGLRAEPTSAGAKPRLDPDWLETVAAVRPALARLEAVQLAAAARNGGQTLRAWTNRPGDPWQTVPPPPSDIEVVRATRLTAAFGPPNVLPPQPAANTTGTVAVAVIDRFGETVPDPEHISSRRVLARSPARPTRRRPSCSRCRRSSTRS